MSQHIIVKCLHQIKDRLSISPYISLCFNCSSLLLKDQSNIEISTIKPPQYSINQENTIPIFFTIPNKKAYTFRNKKAYIDVRTPLIKKMKIFCNNLNLNKKTFFLSLDYLDRICSKMSFFDIDVLEQISKLCIILASKFQENGKKVLEVKKCGTTMENNYIKDELYLVQLLDYDLYKFTCYDILIDILHCGFLFNCENFSINKMNAIYEKIENMLYIFSENKYYIDMTHKEIALVIIGLIREILGLEAYNNIIRYIFIIDSNDIQKYLKYLNRIKKLFIIKENNANSNN